MKLQLLFFWRRGFFPGERLLPLTTGSCGDILYYTTITDSSSISGAAPEWLAAVEVC